MQFSDLGDAFTEAPPSMKESFDLGSENYDIMPNIWLPEAVLPGFKEACLSFFWVGLFFCFNRGLNFMHLNSDGVYRNVTKSNRTSSAPSLWVSAWRRTGS